MIKNYFKIAWRNLFRNKSFPFINIGGLAVGMAVAIIIGLWVWDELSFDKDNPGYDHIALVMQNTTNNGEIGTNNNVPYPLGNELQRAYGADFRYVVMSLKLDHILTYGEKSITKNGSYFGPQAPYLLDLKMEKGSKDGLKDPASIMLSQSLAKTYFGNADPMQKVIKIDNKENVTVTGVYEDFPANSSFADLNYIIPMESLVRRFGARALDTLWQGDYFQTYVKIADQADMNKVSARIKDVKLRNVHKEELIHNPQLFLQPMSRWHLYSEFKNGKNVGGRIQYVWLFGIIGIFVLVLACINFMNLSTARSEKRAKEVGILKAIGSSRAQLIGQFFFESVMVASFAFLISLVLVVLALHSFNQIADKKLVIFWTNPAFWLLGLGFSLLTGVIAGSYPALYLSSFTPVKVLKGVFKAGPGTAIPRKVLVVLQFTVSVTLIIGTIIVFRQIQFAKSRPLGYDRNGLVEFRITSRAIQNHLDAVKQELLNAGAIKEIVESGDPVTFTGMEWSLDNRFDWRGKNPGMGVAFHLIDLSCDYGRTVGWQFTQGRDFSRQYATDSSAFVVNEAAAKYMGFTNAVGEIVRSNKVPYTIIGVIKDMVMGSPYESVKPSFFRLNKRPSLYVIIKLNPSRNPGEALGIIETVFKKYNPDQPFDYQFVDTEYAKKFIDEERIGKLAGFFTILAIFISCLGLFGMASFMAEQRIKEIGIRKVLGATVFGLWRLLSKDFVILVIIALLIATPIAYLFMNKWLQNYPYHSEIPWWIFAVSGIGALLITLLTVSYQAIKSALTNPVKSLKAE